MRIAEIILSNGLLLCSNGFFLSYLVLDLSDLLACTSIKENCSPKMGVN